MDRKERERETQEEVRFFPIAVGSVAAAAVALLWHLRFKRKQIRLKLQQKIDAAPPISPLALSCVVLFRPGLEISIRIKNYI